MVLTKPLFLADGGTFCTSEEDLNMAKEQGGVGDCVQNYISGLRVAIINMGSFPWVSAHVRVLGTSTKIDLWVRTYDLTN